MPTMVGLLIWALGPGIATVPLGEGNEIWCLGPWLPEDKGRGLQDVPVCRVAESSHFPIERSKNCEGLEGHH